MARSTDCVEVLVVDDERVIREGLTRKLVSAGFDVRLAPDGRAAFQAFLLERPDLVLLDVMMPGMDGYAGYKGLTPMVGCEWWGCGDEFPEGQTPLI